MELPHVGQHCALASCNRLDFLPVKCDACSSIYCVEHYRYETHNCLKGKQKDVQVPVCPLCMEPVACKRGQQPDLAVSQHIDEICKRNDLLNQQQRQQQATRRRQSSGLQSCSFKTCKQKDLIYLECSDCKCKFCIKHRHPDDHDCSPATSSRLSATAAAGVGQLASSWHSIKGSCSSSAASGFELLKSKTRQISKSGQAALDRIKSGDGGNFRAQAGAANSLQGNLSEQEALAIALSESAATSSRVAAPSEEADAALARAIHESELEARRRPPPASTPSHQKDTCVLS